MEHQEDCNLINGEWRAPKSARSTLRSDPLTGAARQGVCCSGASDIEDAVKAAETSLWTSSSVGERLKLIDDLSAVLRSNKAELARTVSEEIGASYQSAYDQHVGHAIAHLDAIRSALASDPIDQTPWEGRPEHRVRFEPIGVVALITPWNWPVNQVVLKVGAALAAGCPMVLKPSELTPCSSVAVGKLIASAVPNGVFNMVLGDGETGAALATHQAVKAISFTGSTEVGRKIASRAGGDLKRSLLELGGKSPNLLFADCDLPAAITQGVAHCFRNGGQSCNAASRMLVERSIYEKAKLLAARAAEGWLPVSAPPHDKALGPIISQRHFERVQKLIESGVQEGAELLTGGPGPLDGQKGLFVRPTVFADVSRTMTIWREEIFGPVLTITPFENEAEAISLANETSYGLAGYVQTKDAARADRVSKALHVGMVQVNGCSRAPGAPFGGVKNSGDSREAGLWGIRSFQVIKSISGAQDTDPIY